MHLCFFHQLVTPVDLSGPALGVWGLGALVATLGFLSEGSRPLQLLVGCGPWFGGAKSPLILLELGVSPLIASALPRKASCFSFPTSLVDAEESALLSFQS